MADHLAAHFYLRYSLGWQQKSAAAIADSGLGGVDWGGLQQPASAGAAKRAKRFSAMGAALWFGVECGQPGTPDCAARRVGDVLRANSDNLLSDYRRHQEHDDFLSAAILLRSAAGHRSRSWNVTDGGRTAVPVSLHGVFWRRRPVLQCHGMPVANLRGPSVSQSASFELDGGH